MKLTLDIGKTLFGERFFSKLKVEDECWIWQKGTFKDGYGQFWYQGRGISAHRYAWIKAYGEIPGKLFVLHKCDTPRCVNPNHLFLGTLQENSKDMKIKGRAASGENNANSKLTKEDVAEIRRLYTPGFAAVKSDYSIKGLAIRFGVGTSTIHSIVRNESWRNAQ